MPDPPKLNQYSLKMGGSGSRQTTTAKYTLLNVLDEATAEAYLLANTPTVRTSRNRDTYSLDRKDTARGGHWDCQVVWSNTAGSPTDPDPDPDPVPNVYETGVSVGVGRSGEHVTHSLATISEHLADGETAYALVPNFDNAINVTNIETGKPNGAFIDPESMAQMTFTVDQAVRTSLITNAWLSNIEQELFKVNNVTFRGRAAGEVCFFGLTGNVDVLETHSNLSWEFGIRRNLDNLSFAGSKFTDITKKGWHYAWVYSEKRASSGGALIDTPVALYIEQIFREGDLSGLGVTG